MAGSHDKSNWILYETSDLDTEIAASRDDNVNKTKCPPSIIGKLEEGKNYTLTLQYHDANNDIWSDKGKVEFSTASKFPDHNIAPNVPTQGIHFKVDGTMNGLDLFVNNTYSDLPGSAPHDWVPPSDFKVVINGEETEQSLFSITAKDGDDVLIKPVKKWAKFPWFNVYYGGTNGEQKNYIKEILEPLPILFKDANTAVDSFKSCFEDCYDLTSIPENLFANNTAVTDFSYCFDYCRNLTSIPENLFANNKVVTSFENCFHYCKKLTSIPDNLFANNTAVTDFGVCFRDCSSLTSIPENLFANNTAVTDFWGCFEYCTGLTSIPENLFANNTAVTNFSRCFERLTSLTSIPENLFVNNTVVTHFEASFKDCTSLTITKLKITTSNVMLADLFAEGNASKGTVYVPSRSWTADVFKSGRNTNVNVIEV